MKVGVTVLVDVRVLVCVSVGVGVGEGGVFVLVDVFSSAVLGHKKLNTTIIYARVHDQAVADDYYTAMKNVETRLELVEDTAKPPESEKGQLLALVEQLAQPEVSPETRMDLAMQIRNVLTGNGAAFLAGPSPFSEKQLLEDSPPVFAQS